MKSGKFPDLPTNWLGLIVFLYGIDKTSKHLAKGTEDATVS